MTWLEVNKFAKNATCIDGPVVATDDTISMLLMNAFLLYNIHSNFFFFMLSAQFDMIKNCLYSTYSTLLKVSHILPTQAHASYIHHLHFVDYFSQKDLYHDCISNFCYRKKNAFERILRAGWENDGCYKNSSHSET